MFELPQRAIDTAAQVESFFQRCVLPSNRLWEQQAKVGQAVPDILRVLRAEVKELGLWNMVLPRLTDDEPGLGLTNLEFTAVAEILGRLEWASHVFNYNAPDVANMELLQLFGNEEQKRQWLTPPTGGRNWFCLCHDGTLCSIFGSHQFGNTDRARRRRVRD